MPCDTGAHLDNAVYYDFNEWYYDPEANVCKKFKFTGFGGNANRFHDKIYCEALCKKRDLHRKFRILIRNTISDNNYAYFPLIDNKKYKWQTLLL